jgi:hypothetical protein
VPYLPLINAEDTVFPQAADRDLTLQLRMIAEQYKRFYPATDYYQLTKKVTPVTVTPTADRTLSGEAATTKFDSVYGEVAPTANSAWVQPHGTAGAVPATELDVFAAPIHLHSRRQRISKETELKKYGFDKQRDLLIFVPLVLLDEFGITVKHGDKFIWDSVEYRVMDHNKQGYWKNTNIALFMAINANQYRKGS